MPCPSHELAWFIQRGSTPFYQAAPLLPFLYRTRTIERQPRASSPLLLFQRGQHSDSLPASQQSTIRHEDKAPNVVAATASNSTRKHVFGLEELEKQSQIAYRTESKGRRETRRPTPRSTRLAPSAFSLAYRRLNVADGENSSNTQWSWPELPKREVSHSGEHYVNISGKHREWTKPADLSKDSHSIKEQKVHNVDEQEALYGSPESSLELEMPLPDGIGEEDELYSRKRDTTITDFERQAFGTLFADLVKKSTVGSRVGVEKPGKENTQEADDIKLPESSEHAELNALLRSALVTTANTKKAQVSEFPSALRDLASDALAQISQNEAKAEAVLQETRFIKNPVVKNRMDELQRVTARMMSSKTDFELWKILDEELFSKFRTLDLDGIFSSQSANAALEAPKRKRGGRVGKESGLLEAELVPRSDAIPARGPPKPDLTILAPNYPLHLLTALRLLTRRTRPASPLALHILPTLKSLGPSSHILGASTALYNELLHHQWYHLSSLQSVMSTLREMDEDGLTMDAGTFQIIDSIGEWRWNAVRGRFGEAVRALEEQEWRLRAGVEIQQWKNRWLQVVEEQRDRQAALEADVQRTAGHQWQVTEHPGAFGNRDLPPGPYSRPDRRRQRSAST